MERKRWLPHFQSANRTPNRKVIRGFPSRSNRATYLANANNKRDHILGYIQDFPQKSRVCNARNPRTKNRSCPSTIEGIRDEIGDFTSNVISDDSNYESSCFTMRRETYTSDIKYIDERKESLPTKNNMLLALERQNFLRNRINEAYRPSLRCASHYPNCDMSIIMQGEVCNICRLIGGSILYQRIVNEDDVFHGRLSFDPTIMIVDHLPNSMNEDAVFQDLSLEHHFCTRNKIRVLIYHGKLSHRLMNKIPQNCQEGMCKDSFIVRDTYTKFLKNSETINAKQLFRFAEKSTPEACEVVWQVLLRQLPSNNSRDVFQILSSQESELFQRRERHQQDLKIQTLSFRLLRLKDNDLSSCETEKLIREQNSPMDSLNREHGENVVDLKRDFEKKLQDQEETTNSQLECVYDFLISLLRTGLSKWTMWEKENRYLKNRNYLENCSQTKGHVFMEASIVESHLNEMDIDINLSSNTPCISNSKDTTVLKDCVTLNDAMAMDCNELQSPENLENEISKSLDHDGSMHISNSNPKIQDWPIRKESERALSLEEKREKQDHEISTMHHSNISEFRGRLCVAIEAMDLLCTRMKCLSEVKIFDFEFQREIQNAFKACFELVLDEQHRHIQLLTEDLKAERFNKEYILEISKQQEKRALSELENRYKTEFRNLQMTMDAAIVEAQTEAAKYMRFGALKIKEMQARRDSEIDQAVKAALSLQESQSRSQREDQERKIQVLAETLKSEQAYWSNAFKAKEEQHKLALSEMEDRYQFELRHLQNALDTTVVAAQAEATRYMESGMQKLKEMEGSQRNAIDQAVRKALVDQENKFKSVIEEKELKIQLLMDQSNISRIPPGSFISRLNQVSNCKPKPSNFVMDTLRNEGNSTNGKDIKADNLNGKEGEGNWNMNHVPLITQESQERSRFAKSNEEGNKENILQKDLGEGNEENSVIDKTEKMNQVAEKGINTMNRLHHTVVQTYSHAVLNDDSSIEEGENSTGFKHPANSCDYEVNVVKDTSSSKKTIEKTLLDLTLANSKDFPNNSLQPSKSLHACRYSTKIDTACCMDKTESHQKDGLTQSDVSTPEKSIVRSEVLGKKYVSQRRKSPRLQLIGTRSAKVSPHNSVRQIVSIMNNAKESTPARVTLKSGKQCDLRILLLCRLTPKLVRMVKDLGAALIESMECAQMATHVVIGDSFRPSSELLIALTATSVVVTMDWLVKSSEQQRALPHTEFLYRTPASDVSKVSRVKNPDYLRDRDVALRGWSVVFCDGVIQDAASPWESELGRVIQDAGGKIILPENLSDVNIQRLMVVARDPLTGDQLSDRRILEATVGGAKLGTVSWLWDCILQQDRPWNPSLDS